MGFYVSLGSVLLVEEILHHPKCPIPFYMILGNGAGVSPFTIPQTLNSRP